MPLMIYLILRSGHRPRLEGRTTSMQRLQDLCMPQRERRDPGGQRAAFLGRRFRGGDERTGST
jgi:hypothetical protein